MRAMESLKHEKLNNTIQTLKQKLDDFFMNGKVHEIFIFHRVFDLDPDRIKIWWLDDSMENVWEWTGP